MQRDIHRRLAITQDALDAISARSACRSWRAAGEQLQHPRLTVYTDNDYQALRMAKGLRTSVRVRCHASHSTRSCSR